MRKNTFDFVVKKFVLILMLIFPCALFPESFSEKLMCVGVSDGDTISVIKDGREIKIKIDGVDCPEMGQDFGKIAKQFTSDLVFGKIVEVNIKGLDKYGTTIAYIVYEKKDVGFELIKAGLAWNYKQYSSDDPIYALAEQEAKYDKIGIWSMPNPISPWDFRSNAFNLIDNKSTNSPSTPPAKAPPPITNHISDRDKTNPNNAKYIEALKDFELELKNIVKTDIKQLESRWDQFVTACLINSDSKKYLYDRKWFQFYEDLKKEKEDISLVYKLKYYDNATCISYETEIINLISSIKIEILRAEKNANSAGVYSMDISSIEKKYLINRREWQDIELKEILKQKDIRDYKWLTQI
jgi:endonuclease YncB( thermonuclease family)